MHAHTSHDVNALHGHVWAEKGSDNAMHGHVWAKKGSDNAMHGNVWAKKGSDNALHGNVWAKKGSKNDRQPWLNVRHPLHYDACPPCGWLQACVLVHSLCVCFVTSVP